MRVCVCWGVLGGCEKVEPADWAVKKVGWGGVERRVGSLAGWRRWSQKGMRNVRIVLCNWQTGF